MAENTDPEWDAINEEMRDMKALIYETRRLAIAAERTAAAAEKTAAAAMKRADESWELVVMTKNELQRSWWRKLLNR